MKKIFVLTLILAFNLNAHTQKKVKVKYEYDINIDHYTKKTTKELYKIYKYDKTGFIKEIITYGMRKIPRIDTIIVQLPDGSDEIRIVKVYPEDIKKIGNVELFSSLHDSAVISHGYEIYNNVDTSFFERRYKKEAPNTYSVIGSANDQIFKYFDDEFVQKMIGQISLKKYDAQGRVSSIEFMTDQHDTADRVRIQYFSYNKSGKVLIDSTMEDGKLVLKKRYKYDKLNRIISQESTFRSGEKYKVSTISYIYNKRGMLFRKASPENDTYQWMAEYKYEYY